nr:reverse transcriptase domain-containing protein [Tanacetum cinerariifolium]
MHNHIKTYYGSEDREDHLKIFQAAAKTERWAMPTWCHMFNSMLIGNARVWFDDLSHESIHSYDDLKKAFLENYLQQKKYIKDPIVLHNIKQRDGESTKDFVRRYKLESRDVKGAPEFIRISGFMHEITNPKLIKRLNDKIPKTMDEMMRVTISFLQGKWQLRIMRGRSRSYHEDNKRKQIKEMLKAGRLSYLIKELKQNNGKKQLKTAKKGETLRKEKPLAILMVQPWERIASQKITQSFSPNTENFFPPLGEDERIEGPMIIEAKTGGHYIHRMYVDGESASEILYEHCFNRLRPKIKNQLVPAIIPLIGFSGEIPVERGIITLKSSMLVPLECAMVSGPEGSLPVTKPMVEERIKVAINLEHPEQTVMISSTLTEEGRNRLCNLLQRQATDKVQAIQEEVEKLVESGIMKQVHYHDWLSNPVMVKKHNNSWRMCVDFKDLNKACPKDGYPLPERDWKKKTRKKQLSLRAILCYIKMPFGLRNAISTYQRLVDKTFHKQIGRNLKVNVDDLVIKSRTKDEIDRDIEETFKTLREINMKLNPKKCTFGIEEGIFLGYKVSTIGLKIIKRSKNKLHINGKISASLGTGQQAPKDKFSSTPNHSGHGPANTTGVVKTI